MDEIRYRFDIEMRAWDKKIKLGEYKSPSALEHLENKAKLIMRRKFFRKYHAYVTYKVRAELLDRIHILIDAVDEAVDNAAAEAAAAAKVTASGSEYNPDSDSNYEPTDSA